MQITTNTVRGEPVIRISDNLHWAHFDPRTGEIVNHGAGPFCDPTDAELAQWTAAAAVIASRLGDIDLSQEVYIRFGRLPLGGKSRNHATGQSERGISCFSARLNLQTMAYELDGSGLAGAAIFAALGAYDGVALLITGDEIGRGSDGEPVLANVHRLGSLTYDRERGGYLVADNA